MLKFNNYITEFHNIEVGQAAVAHEPSEEASSSLTNPKILASINHHLTTELNEKLVSANDGFQKVRKVLHRFGVDMPALYDIDEEGDEVAFELKQFGQPFGASIYSDYDSGTFIRNKEPDAYLYLIYYLTDEGLYEFHAEVVDEDGLNEIIEDEDEEELED